MYLYRLRELIGRASTIQSEIVGDVSSSSGKFISFKVWLAGHTKLAGHLRSAEQLEK